MNVTEYLKDNRTKTQIISLIKENIYLYQGIDTESKIETFTGILFNMFVKECVQNNQYLSLSNDSIAKVNNQYRVLIKQLKRIQKNSLNNKIVEIVELHRKALIQILEANEYSESIDQILIPCSEYSEEFQLNILRINSLNLIEPIIDIGCGKNCSLIKELKRKGYEKVFGIDQYESENDYILTSNWFDFKFRKNTFGTIISHMAFSNHYKRTIVLNDIKVVLYKKKYQEILESLRKNGLFIYSPALTIIENTIDKEKYLVKHYENAQNKELDTVIIKKL